MFQYSNLISLDTRYDPFDRLPESDDPSGWSLLEENPDAWAREWRTRANTQKMSDVLLDVAWKERNCIYCEHSLVVRDLSNRLPRRGLTSFVPKADLVGLLCRGCGWWCIVHTPRTRDLFRTATEMAYLTATLSVFDNDEYLEPVEALRSYLSSHPEHIAHLSSTQFERLMASSLRDAFPAATIEHVGGTGDGGVDILLVRGGRRPTLVQVKRRINEIKPEG